MRLPPIPWVELGIPFTAAALAIYFMWREQIAAQQLLNRTYRGTARVRHIHDRAYSASTGQTLARLTLEVRPPSGILYRSLPVEWYIFPKAAALVVEGLVVDVRIDRQDPNVIYPDVDWARRR